VNIGCLCQVLGNGHVLARLKTVTNNLASSLKGCANFMKQLLSYLSERIPSERAIMCIVWGGVGLLYVVSYSISVVLRGVSDESVFILGGIFFIMAAFALWCAKQWWMICFGVFIGIGLAVRFPKVLSGEFLAILEYIVISLVWFTVALHMWMVSRDRNTTPSKF
jgi:hypothetical protein